MKDLEFALSVTKNVINKDENKDIFVTQDGQVYINTPHEAVKQFHSKVIHVKINGAIQVETKKTK